MIATLRDDSSNVVCHRVVHGNGAAEAARDELFLRHEFFDPRDLVQVKYEMLRRVRVDGASVSQAARDFGFSRTAFYRALPLLSPVV